MTNSRERGEAHQFLHSELSDPEEATNFLPGEVILGPSLNELVSKDVGKQPDSDSLDSLSVLEKTNVFGGSEADQLLKTITAETFDERLPIYYLNLFKLALRAANKAGYTGQNAEDLAMKTISNAWRGIGSFNPERGSFIAWYNSIAHHEVINRLRLEGVWNRRAPIESNTDRVHEALENTQSEEYDPEESALSRELRLVIDDALGSIKPNQKEVLILHFFHGMTQVEISELTGYPLGTVKTRMLRGQYNLRKALVDHPLIAEYFPRLFSLGAGDDSEGGSQL